MTVRNRGAHQSLFDFFNDLFTNLFFQPDDALALEVLEDLLSEELIQKRNIDPTVLTKTMFKEATIEFRAKASAMLDQHELLVCFDKPGHGGALATRARITNTVKANGVTSEIRMVLLVIFKEIERRRVVTEWTEVIDKDE